jgi:hypothetical protein
VIFLTAVFLLDRFPEFRIDVGDGALGSIKHTGSVECIQVDRIMRRISCRKRSGYAALLAAGPALTWRKKMGRTREAGQPPAAQLNARGSRLPRRTAKRHPALHGGSLHLEPVWFYRQSRRDERVSVLEPLRIGNRLAQTPESALKSRPGALERARKRLIKTMTYRQSTIRAPAPHEAFAQRGACGADS